jgi:hypothetical protein
MFDAAMVRVPQEMKEALLRNDPAVDSFLDQMMEGDARRFFIAARMRAFGAKTLKEFLLMQRDYTLKGLAEKIECPTLVCDNVADTIAGGQAKRLYDALKCPKDYVVFTAEEGADGHCEGGAQVLFHRVAYDWLDPHDDGEDHEPVLVDEIVPRERVHEIAAAEDQDVLAGLSLQLGHFLRYVPLDQRRVVPF